MLVEGVITHTHSNLMTRLNNWADANGNYDSMVMMRVSATEGNWKENKTNRGGAKGRKLKKGNMHRLGEREREREYLHERKGERKR